MKQRKTDELKNCSDMIGGYMSSELAKKIRLGPSGNGWSVSSFFERRNRLDIKSEGEYQLPFPESVEAKICRPTGDYAHENFPESKYAIDFLLDIGTPILAAKGGRIFKVKSDSDKYGLTLKFAKDVNFVAIDHGEGVYTEYLHLGKDSVVVEEGQEVKTGELLGYSGQSGVMSHPHLHLNAFKIENNKAISVPVEFTEPIVEHYEPQNRQNVNAEGEGRSLIQAKQDVLENLLVTDEQDNSTSSVTNPSSTSSEVQHIIIHVDKLVLNDSVIYNTMLLDKTKNDE